MSVRVPVADSPPFLASTVFLFKISMSSILTFSIDVLQNLNVLNRDLLNRHRAGSIDLKGDRRAHDRRFLGALFPATAYEEQDEAAGDTQGKGRNDHQRDCRA